MLAKKKYAMPLVSVYKLSCDESVLLASGQWSEGNDFDGEDPGNWGSTPL